MKLLYSLEGDTSVRILIGAPKANLERDLNRELTNAEYKELVLKSLPPLAFNVREVSDSDIPKSREFRGAWVDVTEASKIDIDVAKAKDIKLKELREKRDKEFEKVDKEFVQALSAEDTEALKAVKSKQKKLREATDPLKALNVEGYNDEVALANIRSLGTLK